LAGLVVVVLAQDGAGGAALGEVLVD
jgi:hypothetical protein